MTTTLNEMWRGVLATQHEQDKHIIQLGITKDLH